MGERPLCGMVDDGEQEPQVPFDRSIGHRLTARPHPAGSPVSDESIPVPLGQRGGISILAEELEEHLYRGPVVPPGPLTLGGGYLFTVDVKKRLQGEWLGLGLCRVLGLRRLARNGATVEGLAKRTGRTPDFIERALSWDAGSVSRWPVGSFGDLAPRGAQMSPMALIPVRDARQSYPPFDAIFSPFKHGSIRYGRTASAADRAVLVELSSHDPRLSTVVH